MRVETSSGLHDKHDGRGGWSHVKAGAHQLAVRRTGEGPAVLYLHGDNGLLFADSFVSALAQNFEAITPVLPGWAGSARPKHLTTVDDLSYVVLDLLEALHGTGLGPVHLVGTSMGAWVAAEVVSKSHASIASLTLCAPVGIKFGGREERSFADLYATPFADLAAVLYGRTERAPDLRLLDEAGLIELAQAEEAVARFAWEPYFHSRTLRHRVHRTQVPTLLVGGGADRFVLEQDYLEHWVEAIGANARLQVIPGGGHR